MPTLSGLLKMVKSNSAYIFLALAAVWVGLAFYLGSYYVLWPALASGGAGVLLRMRPGGRLTWAWATSACVFGLLLSAYVAYAAWSFTAGAFSTTAYATLAVFAALTLVHILVLYLGLPSSKQAKSG